MFSARTIRGPSTGYFHTPVCTVRSRHRTSRGSPTFTATSRPTVERPGSRLHGVAGCAITKRAPLPITWCCRPRVMAISWPAVCAQCDPLRCAGLGRDARSGTRDLQCRAAAVRGRSPGQDFRRAHGRPLSNRAGARQVSPVLTTVWVPSAAEHRSVDWVLPTPPPRPPHPGMGGVARGPRHHRGM